MSLARWIATAVSLLLPLHVEVGNGYVYAADDGHQKGTATASGVALRNDRPWCARRGAVLGSWVRVCVLKTGRCADLQVVDHGPYGRVKAGPRKGQYRGIVDLTVGAAQLLGERYPLSWSGPVVVVPLAAERGSEGRL